MANWLKVLSILTVMAAAGAWWKGDELRRRFLDIPIVKTELYKWRNKEGNMSFSDQAGSPDATVIVVDTSRITPLETPKPPLPTKAAGGGDQSLQKFGKEMQAKQLEFREKQMNQVLEGRVADPRQ